MVGICAIVSVQDNVDSGECTDRRGRDLPSTIFLLGVSSLGRPECDVAREGSGVGTQPEI